MKNYFLILSICVTSLNCLGQPKTELPIVDTTSSEIGHNSVFFELFSGPAGYSLNIQRITKMHSAFAFSYRFGVSYLPGFTSATGYIGGVLGKSNRKFECSVGLGYYGVRDNSPSKVNFPETQRNNLYLTPQIGYRSHKLNNGLLFRAMLTPWLFVNNGLGKVRFTPGFGISIGKVF